MAQNETKADLNYELSAQTLVVNHNKSRTGVGVANSTNCNNKHRKGNKRNTKMVPPQSREEDSIQEFLIISYATLVDLEADGPVRPGLPHNANSGKNNSGEKSLKRGHGSRSKGRSKVAKEEWALSGKKKKSAKKKTEDEDSKTPVNELHRAVTVSAEENVKKENLPVESKSPEASVSPPTICPEAGVKSETPPLTDAMNIENEKKTDTIKTGGGNSTLLQEKLMQVKDSEMSNVAEKGEKTSESPAKTPVSEDTTKQHLIVKDSETTVSSDGKQHHVETRHETIKIETNRSERVGTSESKHVHQHQHQHSHQHQHFHPSPYAQHLPPHMYYPGMPPFIIPHHAQPHSAPVLLNKPGEIKNEKKWCSLHGYIARFIKSFQQKTEKATSFQRPALHERSSRSVGAFQAVGASLAGRSSLHTGANPAGLSPSAHQQYARKMEGHNYSPNTFLPSSLSRTHVGGIPSTHIAASQRKHAEQYYAKHSPLGVNNKHTHHHRPPHHHHDLLPPHLRQPLAFNDSRAAQKVSSIATRDLDAKLAALASQHHPYPHHHDFLKNMPKISPGAAAGAASKLLSPRDYEKLPSREFDKLLPRDFEKLPPRAEYEKLQYEKSMPPSRAAEFEKLSPRPDYEKFEEQFARKRQLGLLKEASGHHRISSKDSMNPGTAPRLEPTRPPIVPPSSAAVALLMRDSVYAPSSAAAPSSRTSSPPNYL